MKTKKIYPENSGKRRKQGGTIVETLVALVLFATFIGGAGRVILSHRQVADQARHHYIAINVAKNQIEQVRHLRSSDYQQIYDMQEENTRVNNEGETDEAGKFTRTTTINFINADLLEVVVTVNIQNPVTLTFDESETVQSYIAKLN